MRRLREEGGFTLVELLTATTIMVIVTSATLLVLDRFSALGVRSDERNESQDSARRTVDTTVRLLRGAAGRGGTLTLERGERYDLVAFSQVPAGVARGENSAGLQRLRLCLAGDGRLLRQVQRWTTAAPPELPAAECGASAFGPASVVGTGIVNRRDGLDRPLFAYDPSPSEPTTVTVDAWVDVRPGRGAREVRLQSALSLRNQNRRPTARFSAALVGERSVILNGSASEDLDGDGLSYSWLGGTGSLAPGAEGVLYDWTAPGPGAYSVRLRVTDPAGASDTSAPVDVVIP